MNDDTQPIPAPVVYTPRGKWTCDVCGRTGPGGDLGFRTHYNDWHWDYRKDTP